MGILTSCSQKHTRYYIGVSQCSDDEWRHKMNHEIVREALFYDGVEVEIRTAKDNNRNQIEDINYFIDRKVDLLIVAPNEAAAVTPVVEKAYGLGIPVVVIDRKILSDRYTAFVGADNCEIGKDVGQYIVNRLGGKGKILEITGLEGSTPAMERHRGLADALKAEPGIEITASVDGAWLQSVAGEKMDSILQDNKDINLVLPKMTAWLSGLICRPDSDSWKRKCCLSVLMRCLARGMEWSRYWKECWMPLLFTLPEEIK